MYYDSMVDVLLERSGRGRAVVDSAGVSMSYEEVAAAALGAARRLSEAYGVEGGSKVAIAPINDAWSVAAIYAIWLAGAVAVVVDPLSHSEDLAMQLEESKPGLMLTADGFAEKHCTVASRLGVKCRAINDLFSGGGWWEGYWRPRSWDAAVIYFYAGVAGRTMEVVHTHSSILASATATAEHFNITSSDKVLVTPPISHAFGLQIGVLAAHLAGGTALLYAKKGRRLNAGRLAAWMKEARPTITLGAPQLYDALISAGIPRLEDLRFGVSGGAPLPIRVREAWERATGTQLLQLYGMTEAAPVSATLPGRNPPGSIGVPVPGVEVRLRGGGPAGELLVRGPVVMRGYGDPEETRRVLLPGGWMRTGDLVEVRDGYLYFRGVLKRMIKYKGYPIFPRDLEALLEKHPAVARAEVYGEPAGEAGEVPVARVWLRRGARVSPSELMDWVNSRVAPYKRVRRVEVAGFLDD